MRRLAAGRFLGEAHLLLIAGCSARRPARLLIGRRHDGELPVTIVKYGFSAGFTHSTCFQGCDHFLRKADDGLCSVHVAEVEHEVGYP